MHTTRENSQAWEQGLGLVVPGFGEVSCNIVLQWVQVGGYLAWLGMGHLTSVDVVMSSLHPLKRNQGSCLDNKNKKQMKTAYLGPRRHLLLFGPPLHLKQHICRHEGHF